jgi:hypothetical protein
VALQVRFVKRGLELPAIGGLSFGDVFKLPGGDVAYMIAGASAGSRIDLPENKITAISLHSGLLFTFDVDHSIIELDGRLELTRSKQDC